MRRRFMLKLEPSRYSAVARLYEAQKFYWPLVGAVLEGTQNGSVYADHATEPKIAFVQHAFGFAQMFGASDAAAERWLQRHALIDRAFEGPKLRLYAPVVPAFLQGEAAAPFRAERQRFRLAKALTRADPPPEISCVSVSNANVDQVEQAFGVVTRFWRTPADFIARANATLVRRGAIPAALCYGAAVAGNRAEIDVLTLPDHRKSGLGRIAVEAFNARCASDAIAPLWDCFTNNAGSMALARAVGFEPAGAPYAFFTIPK